MPKLMNIVEKVDHVFEMNTPEKKDFSDRFSVVITSIAIPPCDYELPDKETLRIQIGSRVESTYPVKLLMDIYEKCHTDAMKPMISLYEQAGEQLSVIIDALLEKGELLKPGQISELALVHKNIGDGIHKACVNLTGVGHKMERAILCPPRQTLSVDCVHGSRIKVYFFGLASRRLD